jgi:hypothetical protein
MKIKLKPRGRPFKPGNHVGRRFKKGDPSPNPGGRPKSAKLSEAYRALLALPAGAPVEIRTNAEAMAYKVFRMGKKGNLGACVEVGDRSEGRPAVSISMEGGDNLSLLVAHMDALSEASGKPDGMIPRRLNGKKSDGAVIDQ